MASFCGTSLLSAAGKDASCPPIVVFSKVYQELKLNFEDSAEVTAEAGLAGVDPTVRPAGEVLPERVADDLGQYAEALRKHRLQMPLLTTAITSTSSPQTEQILNAAKKAGARFYRLGPVYPKKDSPVTDQIGEWKAQLKDLAALNKQIGIGALVQNHSPAGNTVYLGGDLSELRQIVEGFDPSQIGVAFDIGHALVVHGEGWRAHFDALKSHLRVAYVKDVIPPDRWVPFGQGEIGRVGYFKQLKQMGYAEPFSLHIEYDWSAGKTKTRAGLVAALKESSTVLRRWFAEA
jgi:L-ribulose-5-phosphate 3-epimerase